MARHRDDAAGRHGGVHQALCKAIAEFAEGYADQSERYYRALLDVIDSGRVPAETGR